jgi:hypothetical protein
MDASQDFYLYEYTTIQHAVTLVRYTVLEYRTRLRSRSRHDGFDMNPGIVNNLDVNQDR